MRVKYIINLSAEQLYIYIPIIVTQHIFVIHIPPTKSNNVGHPLLTPLLHSTIFNYICNHTFLINCNIFLSNFCKTVNSLFVLKKFLIICNTTHEHLPKKGRNYQSYIEMQWVYNQHVHYLIYIYIYTHTHTHTHTHIHTYIHTYTGCLRVNSRFAEHEFSNPNKMQHWKQ
jgi:hypothetical protein